MRAGGYPSKRRRELLESGGTLLTLGSISANSVLARGSDSSISGVQLASTGSALVYSGSALVDSVRPWDIGATSTVHLSLCNTTAATAGTAIQYSPMLLLGGTGWDTDDLVSRAEDWAVEVRPTSGATVSSAFHFCQRQDGGSWNTRFYVNAYGTAVATSLQAGHVLAADSAFLHGNTDRATGLGIGDCIGTSTTDGPFQIIHEARTDGANNVICATVYNRNAAGITNASTMRIHSFGWTNDSDVYTELASIRGNGTLICSNAVTVGNTSIYNAYTLTPSVRITGDAGGATSQTTFTNVALSAGDNSPTMINVPGSGAAAQVGWIKIYVGTTAYAVPYWAAA
jgi:hypothetical protein